MVLIFAKWLSAGKMAFFMVIYFQISGGSKLSSCVRGLLLTNGLLCLGFHKHGVCEGMVATSTVNDVKLPWWCIWQWNDSKGELANWHRFTPSDCLEVWGSVGTCDRVRTRMYHHSNMQTNHWRHVQFILFVTNYMLFFFLPVSRDSWVSCYYSSAVTQCLSYPTARRTLPIVLIKITILYWIENLNL